MAYISQINGAEISASFANTASYAEFANSSSYASTASYASYAETTLNVEFATTSSYVDLAPSQFLSSNGTNVTLDGGGTGNINITAKSVLITGSSNVDIGGNNIFFNNTPTFISGALFNSNVTFNDPVTFSDTVSLPDANYNITSSRALTASLAITAITASSLRTGSAAIFNDGNYFYFTAPRLYISSSITTDIAGGNGISLTGTVTSNGNIVGGNVINNVSSYTLGTIGQHWNNIFASTITLASSSLLSTASLYARNSNIGINTSLPSFTLDVNGSGNYTNGLTVTGSFTIISGSNTELRVTNAGVTIGSVTTDTHNVTGSFNTSGSVFISGSSTIKGSSHINNSTNIKLGGAGTALIDIDSTNNSVTLGADASSTLAVFGSVGISPGNNNFRIAPTNGLFEITGSNGTTRIGNNSTIPVIITGSVLINNSLNVASITSSLRTNPGTTTIAPIVIASGSNLTTPASGAIEYDGTVIYSTNDASSQRGYVPSTQIFRLTGTGGTITTISNFFGANSAIQLAAGGVYEIEAHCYLAKITLSGTATITISSSAAPVNLNGIVQYGLLTNGSLSGTANQIALFNSTNASSAFAATGTLTTSQSHAFIIRLIIEANASASNLRINFTSNAGGLTPLRGSYYKVTKLPSGNVGNFVT